MPTQLAGESRGHTDPVFEESVLFPHTAQVLASQHEHSRPRDRTG